MSHPTTAVQPPSGETLTAAAAAAGYAPSILNTQPWRWRLGPGRLELFAERARQLTVSDPQGRLLTISCGAALHHARTALAAAGWSAQRGPATRRRPAGSAGHAHGDRPRSR